MGRVDVRAQKKGKLDISHRYNRIPLLPSGPGGILQELVVYDLPGHKGRKNFIIPKLYLETAEREREQSIYGFHYLNLAGRTNNYGYWRTGPFLALNHYLNAGCTRVC